MGQEHICAPYTPRGQDFLSGLSCPSIHNHHLPPLQVSATDEDGPVNSAITYSLIGGNQLGHFAIHPKKGELQVAKALDWEQVSHMGGTHSEIIRAEYSPAEGPECELWSAPQPDASPDLPSVSPIPFLCGDSRHVKPEAGEGLSNF